MMDFHALEGVVVGPWGEGNSMAFWNLGVFTVGEYAGSFSPGIGGNLEVAEADGSDVLVLDMSFQ